MINGEKEIPDLLRICPREYRWEAHAHLKSIEGVERRKERGIELNRIPDNRLERR